jgi:DNA mismatch repair ATPase MutS
MFNPAKKSFHSFGSLKNEIFDFAQIGKYFRKKDHSDKPYVLSDKSCHDLDFDELFMFLDRTNSKIGQQYLYNQLRSPHGNQNQTDNAEKIISELTINQTLRESIEKQLSKSNTNAVYSIATLFQDEHVTPPEWFPVIKFFSFAAALSLFLTLLNTQFAFVLFVVFIGNLILHYLNKSNLLQYADSIPQLVRMTATASSLFKIESLKAVAPNLPTALSDMSQLKRKLVMFKWEEKMQGDLQAVAWGLMELVKIFFLIEPMLLFHVLKQLDKKRNSMEAIFKFVGEVDCIISVASLRKGMKHVCAPIRSSQAKHFEARNLYHPLIPNCIENSISLTNKSVLLTGSNMSGKTSFIRTIGISVLTGQSLNTCFAEGMTMPMPRIFSAIRISDDLMNDKSYYFEEVLTIKEMIVACESGQANLFLLDEIFKGTNTIERIAAGKAVLSALCKSPNIVFVSTHDIELADLLQEEYDLYHFSEIVNDHTVDFDFKLKEGKLTNRNAIRILELNGYPKGIIDEAVKIAEDLDRGIK